VIEAIFSVPISPLCALLSALCSLRSALCALRSALCSLLSARSSLRSALCALRSALCSLLAARCSLRSALCALRSALCSLLSALCSLLAARCSLLAARCSLLAAHRPSGEHARPKSTRTQTIFSHALHRGRLPVHSPQVKDGKDGKHDMDRGDTAVHQAESGHSPSRRFATRSRAENPVVSAYTTRDFNRSELERR
jgi:hypothetical protein